MTIYGEYVRRILEHSCVDFDNITSDVIKNGVRVYVDLEKRPKEHHDLLDLTIESRLFPHSTTVKKTVIDHTRRIYTAVHIYEFRGE